MKRVRSPSVDPACWLPWRLPRLTSVPWCMSLCRSTLQYESMLSWGVCETKRGKEREREREREREKRERQRGREGEGEGGGEGEGPDPPDLCSGSRLMAAVQVRIYPLAVFARCDECELVIGRGATVLQ